MAALSLVAGFLHQPERVPVKEVSCWVVNLASAAKEDPRAPVASSIAPGRAARPLAVAPRKDNADRPSIKETPEPQAFSFQEFPGSLDQLAQGSASTPALPPGPYSEDGGPAVQAGGTSLSGQTQGGEMFLRMRMGQQWGGAKLKYFYTGVREKITLLIQNSPAHLLTPVQERGASLDIFYREDGEVEKVSFSPDFGDAPEGLLERGEWKELPSPRKFGLPFKALRVGLTFDSEKRVKVRITPL